MKSISRLRAKPYDFEYATRLKFGSELCYQTDHPETAIGEDNYFLTAQHLLNPGDTISVVCMKDDGSWMKAQYEVSVSIPGMVAVEPVTEWRHGGKQIIPGLRAVHKGRGSWNVEYESGKVVESSLTKEAAQAFVLEREAA